MRFITCKTTHYTGEVFVDAMKIADNEQYGIVEADNLEQAREIARGKRYCPICEDYTACFEDIVDGVSGWKVGETIVCDNCKGGRKDGVWVWGKQ